jgi:hypothetical protein
MPGKTASTPDPEDLLMTRQPQKRLSIVMKMG